MDDAVVASLRHIVSTYGAGACADARRVEGLLRDLAAGQRREIAVLVAAAREGVPAALLAAPDGVPPLALAQRLARMLEDNVGLAAGPAHWAVTAWASALDIALPASPRDSVGTAPAAANDPMLSQPDSAVPEGATTAAVVIWVGEANPRDQDGMLVVVDLPSGAVRAQVGVGKTPRAVAVTPDRATAFVANAGDSTVTPVGLAAGTPDWPIPIDGVPSTILAAPSGRVVYVGASRFTSGTFTPGADGGVLVPVDTTTGTAGTAIMVGRGAVHDAVLSPDGATAYVLLGPDPRNQARDAGCTLTPVDLATGRPAPGVKVGAGAAALAVSPDGRAAYVRRQGDRGGLVIPVNLVTGNLGTPITVGRGTPHIAISPDGRTAYTLAHGAIVAVNLLTRLAGSPIPVRPRVSGTPAVSSPFGGTPAPPPPPSALSAVFSGIAITPGGTTAYLTGYHGIIPFDLTSGRAGALIPVPGWPQAITLLS